MYMNTAIQTNIKYVLRTFLLFFVFGQSTVKLPIINRLPRKYFIYFMLAFDDNLTNNFF